MSRTKEPTECPICYTCIDNTAVDNTKYGCITNCKHVFHLGCLHKWTYRQDENDCPLCRTPLDMDLLDEQYTLRKILRMKQRQPNNTKIDDILFRLKHDRINTLNWFCEKKSGKCRFYWTQPIPRVPEEKPNKSNKVRSRY
jgi:hypothetical protein